MSKALLVCYRDKDKVADRTESELWQRLALLDRTLAPDNIEPTTVKVSYSRGICMAVFNPGQSLLAVDTSACLGCLLGKYADWFVPGSAVPDGSFAIYRSDDNVIELLTDAVASRTIWYVLTDSLFIASSSQRAIVAFLGEFCADSVAVAWMLSSGTLGPERGWDLRIRRLEGDSRLVLDRDAWTLDVRRARPDFKKACVGAAEHRKRLVGALHDTFERFDINYEKWVCALSGGYDSRAILMLCKDMAKLQCITWGLHESEHDQESDAHIAHVLANEFAVRYRFVETARSDETVEKVFARFLVAGEGRIDFIAGYMDGFALWKSLREDGVDGIIRGDEAFGWKPVRIAEDVARSVGLTKVSDFVNLPPGFAEELPEQQLPGALWRSRHESLSTWRDRLYQDFRIPAILAAMTDLKSAYVEIANPLLSRPIIECVRALPDDLRTDKRLFKNIVEEMTPPIEFGTHKATESPANILRSADIVNYLRGELDSIYAERYLPDVVLKFVRQSLRNPPPARKTRAETAARRRLVPKRFREMVRMLGGAHRTRHLDEYRLAFRAFVAARMCKMLAEDASLFGGFNDGWRVVARKECLHRKLEPRQEVSG